MPKPLTLHWVTHITPQDARDALGQTADRGSVQVAAYCLTSSRTAFARALIAARLEHRSVAAVSKYLSVYGATSSNDDALAACTEPDVIYLVPLNSHRGPFVRYPIA